MIPSSARTFLRSSTIVSLKRSIPRASDWTTSTSENLSTTIPGRKSASAKTRRQHPVSTTFLRYSHASRTRFSKSSSLISTFSSLVIRRTVILELVLMNPLPIGYPSKSWTSTISPFSKFPMTVSISLSKIHIPPDFRSLPSPFFRVTTAIPIRISPCIFYAYLLSIIWLCFLYQPS